MQFLLITALLLVGMPAAAQRIWLEADRGRVDVGDTLVVALWLDAGAESIGSVEAHVRLDTAVWRPVGAEKPFVSGASWDAAVYGNARQQGDSGRLDYAVVAGSAADGTRLGLTGRGVLAWLPLLAVAPAGAGRAAVVLEGGRRRPVYTAVEEPGRPHDLWREEASLAVAIDGEAGPPEGAGEAEGPVHGGDTGTDGTPETKPKPVAGQAPRLQVPTRQYLRVGRDNVVHLDEWVRDGDTPPADLRWSLAHEGPFSARLRGDTLLLRGLAVGEGLVELWVEDPEGNRAAAIWGVEVAAAAAIPTAVSQSQTANSGSVIAYPNPFNASVTLRLELPSTAPARLVIWGTNGQRLRVYETGRGPGRWTVAWDGRDAWGRAAASGVYLYTVEAGAWQSRGKLHLLR